VVLDGSRGLGRWQHGGAELCSALRFKAAVARVWGRAGGWEGAQGIAGGLKEAGRRSRGSGSGRKAAVVLAGDLGRSVARERNGEEGGAVGWGQPVSEGRGTRVGVPLIGGGGRRCWSALAPSVGREAGPRVLVCWARERGGRARGTAGLRGER
jgi:hypothetical protein